ncbi:YveK family protein [Planomicrobium sp. CPCC 101079]|uniref:YveK family protein n=1 Tax=Planomicrobium sp. CPCC 101079 TaxID=2599618 RepID=UPI0011B52386|nr:Wzz/FepE/Etk N-terminal domain-containing protein [Planomicrobium sp. CPCC 101079]TWT04949.1 chain-length determining protein [Planomicrobium sp. CPCC 101079]
MEGSFNTKDFFSKLKKRLPIIIVITLLCTVLSGVLSYKFLQPVYQASTQILVNQAAGAATEGQALDIESNIQLISTYNVIIKSPVILTAVIEELKLEDTVATLNERITVSSTEKSQVLQIDVEDGSMENAVVISNTIASVFQEEIKNLMNTDNVRILAPAEIPAVPKPIKPDPLLNMAIGAVVGFMFGLGLVILLDQMNTTVRTEEDIEEIIGLHVLGVVSSSKAEKAVRKTTTLNNEKGMKDHVEIEKKQAISNSKIGGSY